MDVNEQDFYEELFESYEEAEREYIKDKYMVYNLEELNNLHLLTYILSYTCRHNFIFAYQLRHSGLKLNILIYHAIVSNFIQSGYLDDDIIKEYTPLNIWYPKHPSKETCLKLLEIHDFYKYSVAHLSVIMDWEDIYFKCNLDVGVSSLHLLCRLFNRKKILMDIENKDVYILGASGNIFNDSVSPNIMRILSSFYIFEKYYNSSKKCMEQYNDNIFLNSYNLDFHFHTPNVANNIERRLQLNYVIFKKNIQLSMNKKLPFNLSNKYVAYIGDIQYYRGGDFEYAKWGALNNSIFANYVINNTDKFPDYVIKNAVSNMLINGVINEKLVYKYKPFYLYNYKCCYQDFYEELINKFPFLTPNIYLAMVSNLHDNDFFNYPDFDYVKKFYISYGYYENEVEEILKIKILYKHLDFENECNYDEPKKIPLDSKKLVNLSKNETLPVFQQECLNITDFISFEQK